MGKMRYKSLIFREAYLDVFFGTRQDEVSQDEVVATIQSKMDGNDVDPVDVVRLLSTVCEDKAPSHILNQLLSEIVTWLGENDEWGDDNLDGIVFLLVYKVFSPQMDENAFELWKDSLARLVRLGPCRRREYDTIMGEIFRRVDLGQFGKELIVYGLVNGPRRDSCCTIVYQGDIISHYERKYKENGLPTPKWLYNKDSIMWHEPFPASRIYTLILHLFDQHGTSWKDIFQDMKFYFLPSSFEDFNDSDLENCHIRFLKHLMMNMSRNSKLRLRQEIEHIRRSIRIRQERRR